ncbi:MAG: magnesium transporter [Thermoleophilia bacterium]|nr:magnesium transporter [Thermoleophilia bacterium]
MEGLRVDLQEDVRVLLERRDLRALRAAIGELEPPDLADLLRELDAPERALVFRTLPRALAADVFAELDAESATALAAELTDDETRRLLAELAPDDRTHLLEELPGLVVQKLLNLLPPEELEEARTLLGYPEESVGRLMTPDYVAVKQHWTVAQALAHIRERGRESETIDEIYVTDDRWRLLDAVPLAELVLADPDATVATVMDESYVSVVATEDRERAVELIARYDRTALPVVDPDGVLLGIVTIDDLLDVAEAEATEDIYLGAAIEPLAVAYRDASVGRLYRKRIVWLVALVLVALLSSGVIALFEGTLERTIALAFFIPLLIGAGGNTGAQSATLVVRALATGDLRLRQWSQALAKELTVGLVLGLTMGAASGLLGVVRGGVAVGVVVGLTMVAIVLVANLVGASLPFLLTKVGLDPAVASSPLIATIMDAVGLLIYFTVATVVLGVVGGV